MSFDWNDLRYFLTVARTGRLTVAAERMGTDHATVSRHIANLEAGLGAELFRRSPRGYSLTDAGERLLTQAEGIESAATGIENDIAGERLALSGVVRIGAPEGFGSLFLAPRIGALTAAHPKLELQLVAMPRIFSLTKREADIAIGLERPEKGRLYSRKLTDYTLHLYGSQGYLAHHEAIRSKRDVMSHPLIGYIQDMIFSPQLDYLSQAGEHLTPQLSSTSLFAQLHATKAGAGLCILPDFMAGSDPALQPVLAEEIELTRTFWVIAHEDARGSARIRTVMRFIADEVGRARALFSVRSKEIDRAD
ncbi:LysR family transcriptional regulator [Martelella sp. AMO21009]